MLSEQKITFSAIFIINTSNELPHLLKSRTPQGACDFVNLERGGVNLRKAYTRRGGLLQFRQKFSMFLE